jgi:hypothetical protein
VTAAAEAVAATKQQHTQRQQQQQQQYNAYIDSQLFDTLHHILQHRL